MVSFSGCGSSWEGLAESAVVLSLAFFEAGAKEAERMKSMETASKNDLRMCMLVGTSLGRCRVTDWREIHTDEGAAIGAESSMALCQNREVRDHEAGPPDHLFLPSRGLRFLNKMTHGWRRDLNCTSALAPLRGCRRSLELGEGRKRIS